MSLLNFIDNALPSLSEVIKDPACDHVLISASQGHWHSLHQGSWRTHEQPLPINALSVLKQMCDDPLEENIISHFKIHFIAHDTMALVRQAESFKLTLQGEQQELLMQAILQGSNGIILGSPSSPKELLLEKISSWLPTEFAMCVTPRTPSKPRPNHITLQYPQDQQERRKLWKSMRFCPAVFWEQIPVPHALVQLLAQPGTQQRWSTLDARDPEAALGVLSHAQIIEALDYIVWMEPHYHQDIPPVILFKQGKRWQSNSSSALSNHLIECANRLLPLQEQPTPTPTKTPASPLPLELPAAASDSNLRVTADITELHSEHVVSRQQVASLLQTHITPDNHLLSTHPGIGPRVRDDDSEASQENNAISDDITTAIPFDRSKFNTQVQSSTSPALEALPPEAFLPSHEDPFGEEASEPIILDDFVDDEPDIIEESFDPLEPFDLPNDPMAVTTNLPQADESPTDLSPISELPDDYEELVNQTPYQPIDDNTPPPYNELKRMERELMLAHHDEATGIHADMFDDPPTTQASSEDDIDTSIKGVTDLSIPDDPEIFSSLNQDEPQRPEVPAGLWQPAQPDEPTQITFEHSNFASSDDAIPALAWGDDEHTKQRNKEELPTPQQDSSTTTKLSTLSQRIKALRERQKNSD